MFKSNENLDFHDPVFHYQSTDYFNYNFCNFSMKAIKKIISIGR